MPSRGNRVGFLLLLLLPPFLSRPFHDVEEFARFASQRLGDPPEEVEFNTEGLIGLQVGDRRLTGARPLSEFGLRQTSSFSQLSEL